MTTTEAAGDQVEEFRTTGKELFGHPRGLAYLVFSEAAERFSYYGMQALLVLYLTKQALLPGHLEHIVGFDALMSVVGPIRDVMKFIVGGIIAPFSFLFGPPPVAAAHAASAIDVTATATAITGAYSGLVYLTPLFGGLIADRLTGRTWAIIIGATLMVFGHFLMAFENLFVFAITCLVLGVGFFKGNIAGQVGELYKAGDPRRAFAYQTFLLGVQISVFFAPLIVGFLGEKVAWHWGFGAAGIGMTIALIVYLSGRNHLPPDGVFDRRKQATAVAKSPAPKLNGRDWAAIGVLILLVPMLSLTSLGNQEIFNAYELWGDKTFQLTFFGFTMPTSSLISLDAGISFICMIAVMAFWTWYGTKWREPDEIFKVVIGALISAGAPLLLAFASAEAALTHDRVSLWWGVGFHFLNDIGFSMVFPIGLALFSRVAPKGTAGAVIGIYYLNLFICNGMTGYLAGLIETMDGFSFWAIHAGLITLGSVVMLVFAFVFRGILAPKEVAPLAAPAAA
ncbi:MAG TPA: MFS transporter [Hyphomonadaceae bacterium]|nr:MFS transporter [Hyphomonadaceae bacterium]